MDTKWKKWKTAVSFAAFVVGLSLLLCSVCVLLPAGKDRLKETDYQDTDAFRRYISGELDVLLSAAKQEAYVGGHWDVYEALSRYGYYSYWQATGTWGHSVEEAQAVYGIDVAVPDEPSAATEAMETWQNARFWDEYMADMVPDRNLLYVVVKDGELLYTNIDRLTKEIWDSEVVERYRDTAEVERYNFLLTFSKAFTGFDVFRNIGETEQYNFLLSFKGDYNFAAIVKDGAEIDVYEGGWYTAESDWCLPGYRNFTVDAEGVEIYLAAAKTPQLYLTTDGEGFSRYVGGELYDIYHSFLTRTRQYQAAWHMLIVSLPILLLALCMHKSKRRGDRFLIRHLGKMWFLPKFIVLIVLPIPFLLAQIYSFRATLPLGLVCFWLLYLGAIDLVGNRRKQRLFLREYLRANDLRFTVQQNLVRRNKLTAVVGLAAACAALGSAIITVFAFSDYEPVLAFLFALGACAAAGGAVFCFARMKKDRRLAEDIGAVIDHIEAVKGGNLTDRLTLPEDAELRRAAEELNDIQQGLETALKEQIKSERMKVELITNVSHDIKTPLTSIISYVELLRQEELPAAAREFAEILWEKSQRLRLIVQDVFEVSKAAAGQLPLNIETLDLAKLLRQTLADMAMDIEKSGLAMRLSIPEAPVTVRADGQRLYRVFQNLLQNALQYSLPGSRVFLSLTETGGACAVRVQNTSAMALDDTVDFTERFVRGDKSRTDGGSGLGLSIAKSFTEAFGGSLDIDINADLFTVTVTLPK